MTRNGKIARLPHELRDQLNQRLLDGEQGRQIVDWLNALPLVQEIVNRDFEGRAITEQNLSEWKQGGFRQWLAHQEALMTARVLAQDAGEFNAAAGGALADHLATVIAAKYAIAIAGWDGEPDRALERTLKVLGEISRNLDELRRGDHSAARVKLEQARIAMEGARTEKHVFYKLREWLNRSGGWAYVFGPEGLTEAEHLERFQKLLFGKKPSKPLPIAEDLEDLEDLPPPEEDDEW